MKKKLIQFWIYSFSFLSFVKYEYFLYNSKVIWDMLMNWKEKHNVMMRFFLKKHSFSCFTILFITVLGLRGKMRSKISISEIRYQIWDFRLRCLWNFILEISGEVLSFEFFKWFDTCMYDCAVFKCQFFSLLTRSMINIESRTH